MIYSPKYSRTISCFHFFIVRKLILCPFWFSYSNKSGLQLNWKGTTKLNDFFLFALSNFDYWRKSPVGMANFYNESWGNLTFSKASQKMILVRFKTCKTWKNTWKHLSSAFEDLQNIKKIPGNIFLGRLSINSIRNEFDSAWELIWDTFVIFLVSESRLDLNSPDDQFSIPGCREERKDLNRNGEGLLWNISEDILFKVIESSSLPTNLEVLPTEINLNRFTYPLTGL